MVYTNSVQNISQIVEKGIEFRKFEMAQTAILHF